MPTPFLSGRPDEARDKDANSLTLFHTHVEEGAISKVVEVLRSGWLNEGLVTKEFEMELSRKMGLSGCVAVNSGTAALHVALAASGVGPGDEVIIPPQTFIATGMAVLMQSAKPVFADIDPSTGNISPASILNKINEKTKAVIPVHWGGYPCDMDEINSCAKAHGITVIEDAAHAFGAEYKGQPIGTLSRFTAFSFQTIKMMTSGDGGLICAPNSLDETKVRALRWFGIDRTKTTRSENGALLQDIAHLGYKYHMNNVAAAIGLGNLNGFKKRLARRREIASIYRDKLCNIAGLKMLRNDEDRKASYWLFTILVDQRDKFMKALASKGIPSSVVDFRIDRHTVFGSQKSNLPGQDEFEASQISIPIHEGLRDEDVARVLNAIKTGW